MNGRPLTLSTWFSDLPTPEQVRFLVSWVYELTIAARDYYQVGLDGLNDPVAVRVINEVQHRVSAHARNILDDPEEGQHPPGYGMADESWNRPDLAVAIRTAAIQARRTIEMSKTLVDA